MTCDLFPMLRGGSTMDDCAPYDCTGDMRATARRGTVCWEAQL